MPTGQIIKRLAPIALLALVLYAPTPIVEQYLGPTASSFLDRETWPTVIQPLLKVLLGCNILKTINAALTSTAQNNWRISARASKWDWPREVAVVTGGCGGLGSSLVAGLTARGVRVAVLDVAKPDSDAVAQMTKLAHPRGRVEYFQCDVTSRDAVEQTAERIRKTLGDPSILINNAGVANRNSILQAKEADIRRVLGVNLMAMWWTTQQFLPAMIRHDKGHIFTTASLASYIALPTAVEYSATKAGALAFHEGLASEIKHVYKSRGVVTSIVHPNFVRTPMTIPHADVIERAQKMLTVEDVTGPMLNQIFSGKGGQIVVPGHLAFLSGMRGWPSWLQESLRDLLGSRQ